MRQKELRIALVCYGGVSLAVYMHGVTKELWKLACASRSFHAGDQIPADCQGVYRRLLERIQEQHGLRLRVLPDIIAGASAGGINGIFLAQAIYTGQSLEPLTDLWLECADVEVLLDPDARPWSRFAKFWAAPIVRFVLTRPGNVVSASVAPETRREVRSKLSRFIRSRWFEPPFGGLGFSRLLAKALEAMARAPGGSPLLPPGHPIDLMVTATDFKGHVEMLRLNSPPVVTESEHRLPISFHAITPANADGRLASPLELVFAARATASFPGAFPALQLSEIDTLAKELGTGWDSRAEFVARIMPEHAERGETEGVALIDGSVLVNAPFAGAMGVLAGRPAQREVDRRFVYIDPTPDSVASARRFDTRAPGFFSVIFGSLSAIPREQPVRDNLEQLAGRSREMAVLRAIIEGVRPEVEEAVMQTFGWTLFLDRPTASRLEAWRNKAHHAAAAQAGFTYNGYANLKIAGIVDALAVLIRQASPGLTTISADSIAVRIGAHLNQLGMDRILDRQSGHVTEAGINFFRDHDLQFRIRRLRLLTRRLAEDWAADPEIPDKARENARNAVYSALALYFEREPAEVLGDDFPALAATVLADPGAVLSGIALRRQLPFIDHAADTLLAAAMIEMPPALRRKVLLTYLGFPFYDTITLPLLRGEGVNEFEPAKVDRISPDDCHAIRKGGAAAMLRGTEFYNFGAFFSRAYRENDYLWGRLHGAERMIDLIASTLGPDRAMPEDELRQFRREAFLAILDEEGRRLHADPGLVAGIRREVEAL